MMGGTSALMRMVGPCFRPPPVDLPFSDGDGSSRGSRRGGRDELLWCKDIGKHACGEFSFAVVQANNLLEDHSQIEAGPLCDGRDSTGTFVGVYDGHGGPEAARYVAENLFLHLKKFATEQQEVTTETIRSSYAATEEGFLGLVKKQWVTKPQLASVGACCLVGVIYAGVLYVANLGDSRAVLAKAERGTREVTPVQLTAEHNASQESVREELRLFHPDDPKIVMLKYNVWRVKGLIQVSRTIGDAYLKKSEFNREPLLAKFRLAEPFDKPILNSDPSIVTHKLAPEDQFVIFASDGLWEHLSNQEAVDIVSSSPRNGVAKRLVKAAMQEAAKKRETRYSDLKKIERGVRRHFHDDITVVVLFLDHGLVSRSHYHCPALSVRGGGALALQPHKS